ncbi:Outer membrane protein beta-barrel domain-containing protein [Chitinophaga costaii]|uniref:Outer membrane protein beta-barrel domain-containing protein n=1 Tax=Chitinophaga costaii TaxID=1335309 RepID=A0A1C4E2V1_9BACT|nr:porin family protein [Chitinophaga costaii]SCC37835.1 Outer membrane protein beta-barrel domain-containing protein [Chitinophaga costaii]
MRNVIVLCLLLFCAHPLFAQTPIEIGVKGGLSIPNLTAGNKDNPLVSGYSSRVGPDFAVQVEFHLSKHFSIQPQLEYSAQGGKRNGYQAFPPPAALVAGIPAEQVPKYLYATFNSTAKFNYLMLPILAKYRLQLAKRWGFYVAAGPFVSRMLNAKQVTSGTSVIYADAGHTTPIAPETSLNQVTNIKDDLHDFNAGLSGHVGFAYMFGKSSVFVEGGGNYGFVKAQKSDVNGSNNTGAGVVNIGYSFRVH